MLVFGLSISASNLIEGLIGLEETITITGSRHPLGNTAVLLAFSKDRRWNKRVKSLLIISKTFYKYVSTLITFDDNSLRLSTDTDR